MKLVLGSLFVLALPFAVARADRGPGDPHGPPPQAAFDACARARAGDACSMTLHDHTISGTCAQPPGASALACRPDHPPGPPPEALEACAGKAAGDACSVSHDGHAFSGTCAAGPAGSALACRPAGPPPR
jgi:hypothetical protein